MKNIEDDFEEQTNTKRAKGSRKTRLPLSDDKKTVGNENTGYFVEIIGGVTFIVGEHSAEEAKKSANDYFKDLIESKCMSLEVESA